MSASPDTSFFDQNISELSEDEPLPSSAPSIPRIKLKLRLTPTASSSSNHNHDDNTSKKHKRKKKRSQKKHKHSNHSDNEHHQQHRRHSELVDIDDYEQPSNNDFDDDDNDVDKYPDYSHMPVGGKRPFAMLAQDTQDENENDDFNIGTSYDQSLDDDDEEQTYTDDDQQIDEDDNYVEHYDDEELDDLNTVYPTDTSTAALPSKKSSTNRSNKTVSKASSKTRGKSSKQSFKDAKAKAAKKRGRPTKKAQAKASMSSTALPPMKPQPLKHDQQYQGSATGKDHGKGLKATCFKLWDTLSKRDAYGFFLEPVDTKLVRDYLSVIKQPMDFSTLYRKIENDNYKTMDDFRTDFLLIVHNAKLYNAPDTIYWKSADKLENYGIKAIERAEKLVQEPATTPTTQPHRQPFSTYLGNQQYSWHEQQQQQQNMSHSQKNITTVKEEEVDILGLDGPARKASRAESERLTREPSLDPHSRAMTPMRQQPKKKKKKKVTDSGVIYGPDGSIHAIGGVNDLHTLLPSKRSFSDPPQLTTINPQALPSAFYQPNRSIHDDWASHKHFQQPAIFCDYGPFPFTTLGSSTPAMFYQQQDARYVYTLYGDDTGEAYLKSMWRFLDDLGLNEKATTLSRTITRGAFDIMAAVVDNMDNNNMMVTHGDKTPSSDDIDIDSDDNNNKSSLVLDTELGEVDVGAILSELQQQRPVTDDTSTKLDQQNQQIPPPTTTSDEKVNVSATVPMYASESPSISTAPMNTT